MTRTLRLFEGIGIELEFMIVDAKSLAVRPIADELLKQVGGGYELQVELGDVAWSNELQLHVIEMKSNGPVPSLAGLAGKFQAHAGIVAVLRLVAETVRLDHQNAFICQAPVAPSKQAFAQGFR